MKRRIISMGGSPAARRMNAFMSKRTELKDETE